MLERREEEDDSKNLNFDTIALPYMEVSRAWQGNLWLSIMRSVRRWRGRVGWVTVMREVQ